MNYLENSGFQHVVSNYRYRKGEIDLILVREGLLIFVEVKSRTGIEFGWPEEFLSESQQEKIKETAEYYLEQSLWTGRIRFDLVAVTFPEPPAIMHFEDAY